MKRIAAAVISLACLFPSFTRAQALADRVPVDAIAYFGWAGATALADGYGPSHLKAVLDETHARDLFGKYLDEVEAKVVKQEPEAKEAFRIVRAIGAPMWKYPTAVFVGPPDFADMEHPKFHFAILIRAGADASKLADELTALLAKVHDAPTPIKAFADGDIACLSIGYEDTTAVLAGGAKGSIDHAVAFIDAIKQVSKTPATVMFVNAAAIVATAEDVVGKQDADAAAKVKAFLDASGLRSVKSAIATGGFDGKDWVDQTFLSAPGERTGLFTAFPSGPTDPALMKAVPADATFFASARFDTAKFVKSLREAVGKTDEQGLQYFNMGLNGLQQALGTNVLENVLEPLGSDWVLYNSPRTGASVMGMVAANKLDDPEKFKKAMTTASINLTNWINVAIRKSGSSQSDMPPMSIHGAMTKIGDVDVYYLAVPIVAPAWAIKDGKVYFGLYPQSVGAAARTAAKGGPSILDSEKYQALLKRLGNASPDSSSYFDLETSAKYGGMYPQMMVLARYAGFGDLFGVTLPEPLLPPIDVLLDHLSPAGAICWSDSAGFHKKSVTPFPGAMVVSEQAAIAAVGAGGGAMVTSILLPSLNRAREVANRVKSASNLRAMGQACFIYASDNKGHFPDDFAAMTQAGNLQPEVFINPRDNDEATDDYVYLGKGQSVSKIRKAAEVALAFETPDAVEDGVNILFCDGHVEFVQRERAVEVIEASKAVFDNGGL